MMEIGGNHLVDIGDAATEWRSAEAVFPSNTQLFVAHLLHIHQLHCLDCTIHSTVHLPDSTDMKANIGNVVSESPSDDHMLDHLPTGDHTYNSHEENPEYFKEISFCNGDSVALPNTQLPIVDIAVSKLAECSNTPDVKQKFGHIGGSNGHESETTGNDIAPPATSRYLCSQCARTFTRSASLRMHERSHIKRSLYFCNVCGKQAANRSRLEYHMRHHSGDRRYACRLCPKMFYYKSHLDSHTKAHEGRKDFRCELCDKAFLLNGHLKSHMLSHTGARRHAEKLHMCQYCGRGFRELHALRNHYNTHAEVPKTYTCPQCGKTFSNATLVKKHRNKTHDRALYAQSTTPTVCHLCGSQFTRRDNLSRHMKTFHNLKSD